MDKKRKTHDTTSMMSSLLGGRNFQPPQTSTDAVQPNITSTFLQQVIEQASQKLGLDFKNRGEGSSDDVISGDDVIMKYVNSIASSLSAPPKPAPITNCGSAKFDFSLLLPKNKIRDLPKNNVWFPNMGQGSTVLDQKSETGPPGTPFSPSSDISSSSSPDSLSPPPSEVINNIHLERLLKRPATSEVPGKCRHTSEDVSPSKRKVPRDKENVLPFDLESYRELTSPVSDMTYNVLPFASSAKVLDLSTCSAFHPTPKMFEVDQIKLLDIWDVLSWFALDYLLTAETLAEDRNKHLLSFGIVFVLMFCWLLLTV